MSIDPRRVQIFDDEKKSEWLYVDIHGVFHTWMLMITLCYLFILVIRTLTGIELGAYVADIFDFIKERLGSDWAFGILVGITFIPPFVTVFVLRRNICVIGAQRQFRYMCRWF